MNCYNRKSLHRPAMKRVLYACVQTILRVDLPLSSLPLQTPSYQRLFANSINLFSLTKTYCYINHTYYKIMYLKF